jgi:hypothetical protein
MTRRTKEFQWVLEYQVFKFDVRTDSFKSSFVMKYQFAVLFLIGQLISILSGFCLPSLAEIQSSKNLQQDGLTIEPSKEVIDFPEVGLKIPKPGGFEKATSFYGFQQATSSSSVLLSKVPAPFSEIRKAINKNRFAQEQLSLIAQQPIKISNKNGLLLQVEQSVFSQKVQKWIVVFGDDQNTYWITAAFLQENAHKLSDLLKKTILAATVSSSQTNVTSLPFTINPVAGLTMAQSLSGGKAVAFTKDGQIPQTSPQDPIFIVAPSLGDVLVLDRKSFANRRLYQYRGTKINSIESSNEISIDNLSGWETEATGQDQKTKTPLKLYQVMLFPEQGGYILMTGIVGAKQAHIYIPKFKAIAQTYKNSPVVSKK